MKTRKSMATLAILLSAGFGVSACSSGGDSANSGDSSSSQQEQQGITDEQKQQLESAVQDYYKALGEISTNDAEPNQEQQDALDALQNSEGGTIDEIVSSIDESMNDQQKSDLLDFYNQVLPLDKVDTSDLSDSEKIVAGTFMVYTVGMLEMTGQDMPEVSSVDLDKVEFGEDDATIPAYALDISNGASASASASESASASASAESIDEAKKSGQYDVFKLVDGQWKVDGRTMLDKFDVLVNQGQ